MVRCNQDGERLTINERKRNMLKITCKYRVLRGEYHVELTSKGVFFGGGNSGCRTYDSAYDFASKLSETKGGRLESFSKDLDR